MPLCDDVVPPVNVDSLSLRLKFGKRNGTAASWLCNLINSIIFLCHMLHYSACWDAAALSLIAFLLPVAFDFASLVCMYLAPHHPPWVTVPTFCIAELHGFSECFMCPLSHSITQPPPQEVSEINSNTHSWQYYWWISKQLWMQHRCLNPAERLGLFTCFLRRHIREKQRLSVDRTTLFCLVSRISQQKDTRLSPSHQSIQSFTPLLFCLVKRFGELCVAQQCFVCCVSMKYFVSFVS